MEKFLFSTILASTFLVSGCNQTYQPEALKLQQAEADKVVFNSSDSVPSSLSEWSLFHINNGQLNLHSTAVPYHLNTPLFSDYAHKFRSLWLPDNTKLRVLDNGDLEFPIGSIISKTFYYPRDNFQDNILQAKQEDKSHSQGSSIDLANNHLIETRILVKQTDGWLALPYIWNAQQTEANLEVTGGSQAISLTGASTQDFTYIVPDANQCKGCHVSNHTSGKLLPIGPKLKHLNLDYQYSPTLTVNQLKHLQQLGKIESLPANFKSNLDWRQRSSNLTEAARSYLDINCAHCHNPDGPADTSALYLNKENMAKAHLGICKTPVAAGKGTGGRAVDISPGEADESIVIYRMESNDPSVAMPELGRAIIHEEGVALIKEWINSLDGHCEIPQA